MKKLPLAECPLCLQIRSAVASARQTTCKCFCLLLWDLHQSPEHGMVQTSLLHAGDMAENEWCKCQDYEKYCSQMMTAWKEKNLQRTHGFSQRQCGSTVQERHLEVQTFTFMFNIVISVPGTAGRPQRPILLLKTILLFFF